jgi:hypothetical protein
MVPGHIGGKPARRQGEERPATRVGLAVARRDTDLPARVYTILNSRGAPPGAGSILDVPGAIGDLGDQQRRCVNRTTMAEPVPVELSPTGTPQPAGA